MSAHLWRSNIFTLAVVNRSLVHHLVLLVNLVLCHLWRNLRLPCHFVVLHHRLITTTTRKNLSKSVHALKLHVDEHAVITKRLHAVRGIHIPSLPLSLGLLSLFCKTGRQTAALDVQLHELEEAIEGNALRVCISGW